MKLSRSSCITLRTKTLFEMCGSDKKWHVMQKIQIELKISPAYFPVSLGFADLITERSYPHKSNQRGSLSKGFIAAAPPRSGLMYFSYETLNCPFPAALWDLMIICAQSLQQSNKHNWDSKESQKWRRCWILKSTWVGTLRSVHVCKAEGSKLETCAGYTLQHRELMHIAMRA